jgi:hypothetical protein
LLSQPVLVDAETLGQVLLQYAGSPLAETHAALGFDPVADGYNDVQIVVIDLAADLPFAFLPNYPEFPDSAR